MTSGYTSSALLAALVAGCLLSFNTVQTRAVTRQSEDSKYAVYVSNSRLMPLVVYAPPGQQLAPGQPRQLGRSDVPAVLCGAHVVAPDLLVASIVCAPSQALQATLYVVPASLSSDTELNLKTRGPEVGKFREAVSEVQFVSKYTLPDGTVLQNVALILLNKPYFEVSKSIF